MKSALILLLTLLILSAIIFLSPVPTRSSTGTTITVNPRKVYVPSKHSFTINITVCNVTNLNAWELRLAFNPFVVNCAGITIPGDNIFEGSFFLFPPEINNTQGYVLVFCALEGTYGVNGSGILCQIEFSCLLPGISSLEIIPQCPSGLCDTYLQEPDYNLIPFETVDGTVVVTEQGYEENLFNITINGETYSVLIFSNSTITGFHYNQTFKEIMFDATGTTGTNGSTSIVIPKSMLNETHIMILIDNAPNFYSPYQNATHNFWQFTYKHTTGHIKILDTLIGDTNGDRKVRVDDVLAVALAFSSEPGDPKWHPYADLNGDGKIRVDDILIVAGEFGKEWTP